jgi:ABC-2 type transport system permease protein
VKASSRAAERLFSPSGAVLIAAGPILGALIGLATQGMNRHLDPVGRTSAGYVAGIVAGALLTAFFVTLACTKIPAVAGRTLRQFLTSPLSYLVIAAYLGLCGLAFYIRLMETGSSRADVMFQPLVVIILSLVTGVVTMGLVAGERSENTLEGLMTAPVSDVEVALGKYFGAVLFFMIMEAPRALFLMILLVFAGKSDDTLAWGEVYANYLGLLLVILHLAGVGLMFSAAVREQFLAIMLTMSYALVFGILLPVAKWSLVQDPGYQEILTWFSFVLQYAEWFNAGRLVLGSVVFFAATSIWFVVLTILFLFSQRWR